MRVLLVRADRSGEFKGPVPSGEYIAVVSAPGFATSVVAFRVGRNGKDEHLEIKLGTGPRLQPVT